MPNDISNPQPLTADTQFSMDWFGEFSTAEETITIPSHYMTWDLNVIAQALGIMDIVNILDKF